MLQYLSPITLKEMYNDLDEARLDLLNDVNEDNLIDRADEYHKLNNMIEKIDAQYKAITGNELWLEVELEIANA